MTTEPSGPGERTTGLRAIFSLPRVYRAAQNLIGAESFRRSLVDQILDVSPGDRVLDIGCGTADIVVHLPPVDYVGYDHSDEYIDSARRRHGSLGTFIAARTDPAALDRVTERDLAMAVGVLHHMDDEVATASLEFAASVLRPGGRLVTIDPTIVAGQHPVGRWLAKRDRGQHVRSPEATLELIGSVFPGAEVDVHHDLLRVPYSHVVCRAIAPSTQSA